MSQCDAEVVWNLLAKKQKRLSGFRLQVLVLMLRPRLRFDSQLEPQIFALRTAANPDHLILVLGHVTRLSSGFSQMFADV